MLWCQNNVSIQPAGKLLDGKLGFADIFLYNLDGFLHQLLVKGSDGDTAWLDFNVLIEYFLTFDVHLDNLVDAQLEDFHIERLGDIVVCANAKPFQLVFFTCLSCQEDNGDMGVAYVILDGLT